MGHPTPHHGLERRSGRDIRNERRAGNGRPNHQFRRLEGLLAHEGIPQGGLATRIGKKAGKRPAAVLEATGVYSMPIVAYLLSEGYTVYMVSPLESARMRKSEVRPVKNDRIDTTTIARVYYSRTLREFSPQTGKLARLREMASHYRFLVEKGSMERNRFRRCLDAVWPGFDEVLAYDSDVALAVVRRFRHPSRVKKAEGVSKAISKCRCGKGGSRDTSRDIEELLGRMEGSAPAFRNTKC